MYPCFLLAKYQFQRVIGLSFFFFNLINLICNLICNLLACKINSYITDKLVPRGLLMNLLSII